MPVYAGVRTALGQSLHVTFWGLLLIYVLTLLFATRVPTVSIGDRPSDAARK